MSRVYNILHFYIPEGRSFSHSEEAYFVFFPWNKWQNLVLGQLQPYMTTKKSLGGAIKWFKALVLVIYMTHNALLPGQVTHRSHLLFPKTRLCLLSMAIMTKLFFWLIFALNHSRIDPRMGLAAFVGLSSCDIHDKQCTASISNHSWELFTPPKNPILSFF